jgi:hypothetical protein
VRIQLRNLCIAEAETILVKGRIRVIGRRDDLEPPESLALGTFSKGFSRNLGKPHSLHCRQGGSVANRVSQ